MGARPCGPRSRAHILVRHPNCSLFKDHAERVGHPSDFRPRVPTRPAGGEDSRTAADESSRRRVIVRQITVRSFGTVSYRFFPHSPHMQTTSIIADFNHPTNGRTIVAMGLASRRAWPLGSRRGEIPSIRIGVRGKPRRAWPRWSVRRQRARPCVRPGRCSFAAWCSAHWRRVWKARRKPAWADVAASGH